MKSYSPYFRRFAEAIGPAEVAALARTVPSVEADGLVRILTPNLEPAKNGASKP